ncbi:MAG: glutamine synthetase [Gammaproteobacteria bacterium]|nr:glutamine synthetase [Gammaproteobacteria bacterium]
MINSTPQELAHFLVKYPKTRFIDVFLNDLNTVERGKRLDLASAAAVYGPGMLLPGSMFALDVLGGTVQATGLGFDEGDADRPCRPLPYSLVPVPWLNDDVAQLQVSMYEPDGRPFFADPRHVLVKVLDRFHRLNLTPVIALEYEFYFIDRERTAQGMPQPPPLPLTGRREYRTQINSMTDLNEFSAVLAQIDAVCRQQNIPATTALAEYGPGQFEVNLAHQADALRACDEALRFKRVVRSVARAQGWDATFLPKPYRDMAGSGLHVHASILDAAGRNIFECDDNLQNLELRHALGGLVATLSEGMALCAPGPNSFRRFQSQSYVPMIASWSVNNRGSAIRIPVSDAKNRRIEHRLAGADANPYLVAAWMLAGIYHGISHSLTPPPPISGNAYEMQGPALPTHWATAIEKFSASEFGGVYLGKPFQNLYSTVKQSELNEFNSYVTPLEIEWYMGAI